MAEIYGLMLCEQKTAMRKVDPEAQPFLCAHLAEKRKESVREQSGSAYEALFRLYDAYAGEAPLPRIRYARNGKPFFEGDGPFFSLSHTAGMSIACLSPSNEVGVDIESLRAAMENGKADAYRALAVRMFFREELEALRAAASDEAYLSSFLAV